jgi:hypothetical protein
VIIPDKPTTFKSLHMLIRSAAARVYEFWTAGSSN